MVDLPKDLVNVQESHPYVFPDDVTMRSYNPTEKGHTRQIKKAVAALMAAERPVLYVGGGAINSDASEQVTQLAETIGGSSYLHLDGLGSILGCSQAVLWVC